VSGRSKLRLPWIALSVLGWLTGCASIGPPMPASLELPKPPTDLRAARKGDKVTLTWSIPEHTTERQTVRHLGKTVVCRSLDETSQANPIAVDPATRKCDTPVGEVAPPADFSAPRKPSGKKLTANFVEILREPLEREHPTGFATYAVEVLNTDGRSAGLSKEARVPLAPTLAPFVGFAAEVTGQGVLVSWRCPREPGKSIPGIDYRFRIYRRGEEARESRIAELNATECALETASGAVSEEQEKVVTSFLDQTIEWEKHYFYRGAVVSVVGTAGKSAAEVEGDDTPEVKVFAHDVFPPAVPSGLQAVFSGPGQQAFIDLIWAPVTDSDLEGYNVYRHEAGNAAVKINSESIRTPAFRDPDIIAGKTYFYSVSAVDQRGNESARSGEASELVP
jgi:hypothetical protein